MTDNSIRPELIEQARAAIVKALGFDHDSEHFRYTVGADDGKHGRGGVVDAPTLLAAFAESREPLDKFAGGGELSGQEQNTDRMVSSGAKLNAPLLRNEPPAIHNMESREPVAQPERWACNGCNRAVFPSEIAAGKEVCACGGDFVRTGAAQGEWIAVPMLTCVCGVSFKADNKPMLEFHDDCMRARFINDSCPQCGHAKQHYHLCPRYNPLLPPPEKEPQ